MMVLAMKFGKVPMIKQQRSRMRPKIRFTGVMRSSCNLSQEIGLLVECCVGFTKQDEDCFDTHCNGWFEPADVGDIDIDVIVNIDTVRCRCWVAVCIEDALVEGIAKGPCELWPFLPMKGSAPLDLVENGIVLCYQRGVKEEAFGGGSLCASDGFPVGWAEVSTKRKAYLEEQIVGKDVRESTRHIRVMLYLAEA